MDSAASMIELQNAERRRCQALVTGDADRLSDMLSEDLVHIHLTGRIDDKDGYLAGVRSKYIFRDVTRGPLRIRVWGESAVITGELTQKIVVRESGAVHDIRAVTTQSWHKVDGQWLQTTCHNAPLSE